jgi:hypothetical protein
MKPNCLLDQDSGSFKARFHQQTTNLAAAGGAKEAGRREQPRLKMTAENEQHLRGLLKRLLHLTPGLSCEGQSQKVIMHRFGHPQA